jgi:hypothetical protein
VSVPSACCGLLFDFERRRAEGAGTHGIDGVPFRSWTARRGVSEGWNSTDA